MTNSLTAPDVPLPVGAVSCDEWESDGTHSEFFKVDESSGC